ncbi:MAG TPA: hypothetical protein VGF13_22780, partial [Verrucomicrobiae bacterium]
MSLAVVQSHPLDHWHWAAPKPAGYAYDIAYGNGSWVHVSASDVFVSTNGNDWQMAALPYIPEYGALRAIAFGNGIFVLGGPESILTSTNGFDWVRYPVDHGTWSVAYGAGCFVAVDHPVLPGEVQVFRSTNGVDWTPINTPATNRLQTVGYAGNTFIAAGVRGTIITSPDGIVWTQRYTAPNCTWYRVTYGNGVFIASGDSVPEDGRILVSYNSVDWFFVSATPPRNPLVAFGNGWFVALTGSEDAEGRGLGGYSTNGVNWQTNMSEELAYLSEIKFVNDRFVVPGSPPLMSSDGRDWELMGRPLDLDAKRIRYLNNLFLAFGNGTNFGLSSNGGDWTTRSFSFQGLALSDALFVDATYFFVGSESNKAAIVTSTNLHDWNTTIFPSNSGFSSITFVAGVFLAASETGVAARSTDGQQWQAVSTPAFRRMAGGNGVFVAINDTNLWVSSNGLQWTKQHLEPTVHNPLPRFADVVFGNGQFVTVSYGYWGFGTYVSRDGTNWTGQETEVYVEYPGRIIYGAGMFVCGGTWSGFATSSDGLNWKAHHPFEFSGSEMAFGNGTFVTLQWGNNIAQSEAFVTLRPRRDGAFTLSGPRGRQYRIES